MREPMYKYDDAVGYLPVSQIPRHELEYIANGGTLVPSPEFDEDAFTIEFMQIYAARLLRERS